jgi:nitrate reductase delta subunit
MEERKAILKLCSVFLQYPEAGWHQNKDIYEYILQLESSSERRQLEHFWDYSVSLPWLELEQNYVKQFDFSKDCSLYLTYGIFGDKRERGQGFIKLKLEYAKAGYRITGDELPDYLPLILEAMSETEDTFTHKLYYIHKKSIDELYDQLKEQNSPYAYLLAVVLETLDKIVARQQEKERKTV